MQRDTAIFDLIERERQRQIEGTAPVQTSNDVAPSAGQAEQPASQEAPATNADQKE